ncbi:MAG: HEAT repeat domain-containing protein [Verrucomicrobiae bacterium]|nr:HEAT repeat domain-containing protein [Verrucomicrobiae bacterium]
MSADDAPRRESDLPEEKSTAMTLVVQLVVIPLAVVLFCVALGGLFMWLTSERKDFGDYLEALQATRGQQRGDQAMYLLNYIQEAKRWQGIFDVSAQLSSPEGRDRLLERYPQAPAQLIRIFEEAQERDAKTRRYLALVLGLLGANEAIPALRGGLQDADSETVKNCIWALGRLQAHEAAGQIMELTRHEEVSVRLMAVDVLGVLEHPRARDLLVAALNDPSELVQWNAAFGLANRGDAAGLRVLERLLDKAYVDRFGDLTVENRQRYRMTAVEMVARLKGAEAIAVLEPVSRTDPDLKVRNAALQKVNALKKHSETEVQAERVWQN